MACWPGGSLRSSGTQSSITNRPPGVEVAGGVAEARDLLGLGEQVGDRVVDEVDERVPPRGDGGRHVADDHRDRRFVHFGAQLVDHRPGQLDAGDGHPALGERDGHAAGSDGELERRSVAGEFGEAVHGRLEHLGREHAGARRVIALGGVGVPDVLLSHGGHRRRAASPLSIEFAILRSADSIMCLRPTLRAAMIQAHNAMVRCSNDRVDDPGGRCYIRKDPSNVWIAWLCLRPRGDDRG